VRAGRFLVPICFLRTQAFGLVQEHQTEAQVGDTQDVVGPKTASLDAPPVDPRPIGAAQVANEDLAIDIGQAAVATGYTRRAEAELASPNAADE
jgi:hypothetical protein